MEINILGTTYTITESTIEEDKRLKKSYAYTDWTTKQIVIERKIKGNLSNMEAFVKKVKRHEIAHAFMLESGLAECSGETDAWAQNETMIDWWAINGEKVYEAWKHADALG